MAKYKITGVPELNKFSKGGDPGDNFYNYGGLRYKRNPYGQWFYWHPSYQSWHAVSYNNASVDGTPVYSDMELEKMHKQKNPALEATTQKKEEDKQKAAAANTKRAAILNNPIVPTKAKIDYFSNNSPTIENAETLKKLQVQKEKEDAKKAQDDYLKQQEELKRQEEEYLRASNPNFYNSETTQNVARSSGALLTKAEQDAFEERKRDMAEKKAFLGRDYVTENYTALESEETNNAMYGLKGITWDDADKLAAFVLDDLVDGGYSFGLEDDLKAKFPNATEAQIKKYKDYIFDARNKAKTKVFNTVGDWDMSKALKKRHYYDAPWTPDRDQVKAYDPNTTVEMSGRMPKTAGEWVTRVGDIIFNPLDAIHYGMSPTEEMPMNMYEYEKAKQALGYEDGADQNAVFEGLNFASYFTGAGSVAQGMKMLRPTGESIYNFAQDPSLESAGNAALNVGFNALAFSPLKSVLPKGSRSAMLNPTSNYAGYAKLPGNRQVVFGNPAITEAQSVINLPGFKLARGSSPITTMPSVPLTATEYAGYLGKTTMALADDVNKGLLSTISEPQQVTASPLTTMTPAVQKRQPLNIDKALQEEAQLTSAETQLLPEEELQYNMSTEDADFAKLAKEDNELVTDIINDIRERKIGLWMTPEGQRRLQTMIDKTPSLAGQTPQTMIEGIASMNSLNAINAQNFAKRDAIIKKMNEVDSIYEQGYMTETDYFNQSVALDDELKQVEEAMATIQENFLKSSGFYRPGSNTVGINPMVWKSDEIPKVTSHELGHYLGSFLGDGTTYLDDELKKLDLISGTPEQLKLEFEPTVDKSAAFYRMGEGRNNYLSKSKDYFEKGSEGTERVPFIAEVREDMLQKGIIKTEYDKITPKMIKDHYKDYKRTRGEKYPLRIYDIIKDKKENFDIMSNVLNNLPMLAAAAYAYDELANSDDPNVQQASIPALLAFFFKKPGKFKLPKALQKTAGKVNKALRNQTLSRELAKQLDKTELPKPVYKQKMAPKIDPIARSTVNKKNDFVEKLGEEQYNEFIREVYAQNRKGYDAPLIDFKSTKPTSFFQEQFGLPHHLNSSAFLFKQKFCPPGSACAKTSNAVTNKVFSDITGKEFAVEENAHNAWHLEDQMTRHGGMNITPFLQQYGTDLFKVGDRILMGNNVDQSTQVAGYTADPAVRHSGFFAGYYPTEYGDIPMLFESGNINPMYMNPINESFSGSNSIKQVIRPRQFLDDDFGINLVDKNIRYAYRDKPSVAIYSSDNEVIQGLIDSSEPIRDVIKKTYDITNDEFDELLVSLISIGAQETKLGATLPGTKLSKAKIKLQDYLVEKGLSAPVKKTLNTYKGLINKVTSKSSPLPPYPGTSYVEMESAKLASELNISFSEALDIVNAQYKPKPKKTLSTVEPSKGIFRQKFQTEEGKLAGFEKINNQELANGMAQMAENYNKIKKLYPDADPRKIINLTVLMWNSPGKAQNKELVEFYLFGIGNPDPDKFKFDYINKVNNYRDQLINIHPQTTEDYFEYFRKGRPEIQYKKGGQINAKEKPVERLMTKEEIDNLVAEGYIIEEM